MCRTPPPAAVQAALGPAVLAGTTTTTVQGSPSLRLQRTYSVVLSDGRTLQLVLPPPSTLRLLRLERSAIESEAAAVRWIRDAATADDADDDDDRCLVPACVHASSGLPNPLEAPFLFLSPAAGTPLALVHARTPIVGAERRRLGRQAGELMRKLAGLTSPTGKFGPVAALVPFTNPGPKNRPPPSLAIGGALGSGGAETWSAAFHAMLEGILRDGEDMAIAVPYAAVRRNFRRLGCVLDGVTAPRLVVVDGGEDVNILVEAGKTRPCQRKDGGGGQERRDTGWVVSGLQGWSNSLFGDPLIATVFSDGPPEGFLDGFNGGTDADLDTATVAVGPTGFRLSGSVVDDLGGSGVRLLLYQMYHALVSVVREFYRPRVDSSKRELAARKRLNEVLAKLGDVSDDPKRSHRRPSGEMSPAKRVKQEDGGGQAAGGRQARANIETDPTSNAGVEFMKE